MKSWPRLWIAIILLAIISLACRFSANTGSTAVAETPLPVNPTIDRTLIVFPPTGEAEQASPTPPASSTLSALIGAATANAATAAAASPMPTATATPTPVPTVRGPVSAKTTATNVKLRSGPGTLFTTTAALANGAELSVLGKARGDDWLYAQTSLGGGWLSVEFTNLSGDPLIAALPFVDTGASIVVQGRVLDTHGTPVGGVEFAVFQGREVTKPPETRAHSLADGNFYAYLPAGSSGVWRISLTAVDCKSRVVDATCNITGVFAPRFTDVTVPGAAIAEITYLSP
ncbi:MAG TPA: SH3 domain-containing protein [Anaerolineaceae bacterium]